MLTSYVLSVLLVLALCASGRGTAALNSSCMHRWMRQAGIPRANAVVHEKTFLSLGFTETYLRTTSPATLSFFMDKQMGRASALQACLAGTRSKCRGYFPCHNSNGTCRLSKDHSTYKCKCPIGRRGRFCQHEVNWCATTPCQHGGFCRNHAANFTCTCTAGFEGARCEHNWINAIEHRSVASRMDRLEHELRVLRNESTSEISALITEGNALRVENAAVKANLTALKEAKQSQCHSGVLGYAFNSRHDVHKEDDNAQIASISFSKKQNNSLLRLSYSANIRTFGPSLSARWYFMIDGKECVLPSKVDIAMLQTDGGITFIPSYLTGICNATDAGAIAKGMHEITVHVGNHGIFPADAYSGWGSVSFLEVQEICPPF